MVFFKKQTKNSKQNKGINKNHFNVRVHIGGLVFNKLWMCQVSTPLCQYFSESFRIDRLVTYEVPGSQQADFKDGIVMATSPTRKNGKVYLKKCKSSENGNNALGNFISIEALLSKTLGSMESN